MISPAEAYDTAREVRTERDKEMQYDLEIARKEGYRAGYQCGYIDGEVSEARRRR